MPDPTLHDLPTPALVLESSRLSANAERMRHRANELGVQLRPHLKTAKSVDVARIALDAPTGPITVSTLREAEHFAEHGFRDITLAVCLTPDKLTRAAALVERGVALGLITDDVGVAAGIGALAVSRGVTLDVLVEVDVGEHRTGVDPDGDELLAVARRLHDSAGVRLRGVLGHAGQSYLCSDADAVARVAEDERSRMARAAARLSDAGLPCDVVSAGSTPTATRARSGEGLTELRPGVYLFGDLFQAAIGCCRLDDIAVSVLATVIGCRPEQGRLVVDAGALALSKDRGTASTDAEAGYGRLADVTGRLLDLTIDEVHQEHGGIRGAPADALRRLPVGTRVRILPNHACMTAAMYDRYHVVAGEGVDVLATWTRVNGW